MLRKCKTTPQLGGTVRPRKEKSVNLWPYKTELSILVESEKLDINDVPYLNCRGTFIVKLIKTNLTVKEVDDHMYSVCGNLMNQLADFMHWLICVYTLTHKKVVHCAAVKYLHSKGLKLPVWLNGVKEGNRANILSIFIMCKVTQTHCFIHTKNGIWSSLYEDPQTHQEYIQRCNLHLLYLGFGVYAELKARTQVIQYEIFGVPELLPVEVNVNEPAVGTLSVNETDTLQNLIGNGITHNQPKLTVSVIPNTSVLKDTMSALPVTPVMHDPVPSTSVDSNPPLDTIEV